ncbi:hypothetical protein [Streptomyces sp. AC627_RSS907]|uniref:hypothetical protein n=1 Tax=Streptomyces sp. AC627_RSS907 TaxID=2823684 RepID=UPI001C214F47|nr:hypothetical protein [Streptomyces sp. AC627_RSS907]
MTHNFGLHFTQELVQRYSFFPGGLAQRYPFLPKEWPESTEQVIPFFVIVVNALGTDDAMRWFDAARTAHRSVVTADEAGTHQFGFAAYLGKEIGIARDPSLAIVAAWEAIKALYEITCRDARADVDAYFECALRACSRGSGRLTSSPGAAAATA